MRRIQLGLGRLSHPRTVRQIRRGIQIACLVLFVGLFVFTDQLLPWNGFSNLFIRLDPLVAITAMLAGRVVIAGLALAAITLGITLILGRVWCGWICPMGTTLDIIRPTTRRRKQLPVPPPERLRIIKYGLLVFLLAAAVLGDQTLLFLDPITILNRTLAQAVWPAFGSAVNAVEGFLYQFDALWGPLDAVHQAIVYPVFQDIRPVYFQAVPVFLFFAGIIALNWIAERFWCRYLCPLGGLLGVVSRFALFRRVVDDRCTGCAVCRRGCPTATIAGPEKGFASDPAECTMCWNCAADCSRQGSGFGWHLPFSAPGGHPWQTAERQPYDPDRREVLGALGLAAAWTALGGVEPIRKHQPNELIRPPGAVEADFNGLCIRCGACIRACPTTGLQTSFLEGGWHTAMTPHLTPRLGYCAYNCTACGQVCPTGAIPALALVDKQNTPIGLARVDRTRCLPWAYNIACIVCEEACPLSSKAIRLEVANVTNGAGEMVQLQRPYVVKELCIGCGMCEYQCPMGGDAAVRVLAYSEPGGYHGGDPSFGQTGG